MFYQEKADKTLRFGDVLRGYIITDTTIKQPILSMNSECYNYKIDIELPIFSVVLTPCCSIGEQVISLTPLIRLYSDFFKNSHFVEDFTRINREIEPEKMFSSEEWKKFSAEEQQNLVMRGESYALLNLFVYEKNDLFPKYNIRGQETNYYMIDFRNTYKLRCGMIKRPEKITHDDFPILESKCLQLSVQARSELREKIAEYYGRIPEEDEILED